jgi:hypothetical protein
MERSCLTRVSHRANSKAQVNELLLVWRTATDAFAVPWKELKRYQPSAGLEKAWSRKREMVAWQYGMHSHAQCTTQCLDWIQFNGRGAASASLQMLRSRALLGSLPPPTTPPSLQPPRA